MNLLHRLGLVLTGVALFSIAGGHWALLQTVAWARMVQDYSKTATVAEAVEKTFSGEYPCGMCKKIAEAKKKEQQDKAPATVKADKKFETFVATARPLVQRPDGAKFSYLFPADMAFATRCDAPPVPIPIVHA